MFTAITNGAKQMNVSHIATIAAYPIKETLGGGFRGVLLVCETKARVASDRFETLTEARYWAQMEAHKAYDARGYSLAPLRRKGEYQANVWVQV
jgi:hypothetical protein